MSMPASQLNLFDTTVLSGELAALWSLEDDQPIPEVSLPSPQTFRIPQRDFRLNGVRGLAQRGFLTLEAISGHFVEFSHPTGARSGILTIFCFWRRVLNAMRVSR
ncbi:hypothetical protein, partial [Acetobacter pasteurianus]|uniref:hypothetical protein n=1 Tax=Acetobacter pasteurianus TaxID=438 RepID=UPI00248FF1BC